MNDAELTVAICEKALAQGLDPQSHGVPYARIWYGNLAMQFEQEPSTNEHRISIIKTQTRLQKKRAEIRAQARQAHCGAHLTLGICMGWLAATTMTTISLPTLVVSALCSLTISYKLGLYDDAASGTGT